MTPSILLRSLLIACSALVACTSLVRAESTDNADGALLKALQSQRMALTIQTEGLSGPAASWLNERAGKAQFVLIGEDHGFADVPEFALALQRSLGERRLDHLVVEVGPFAVERVEAALRKDADGLVRINRQFPFSMPFLNLVEDGRLAASFVRPDTTAPVLWGIDQEFVLGVQAQLQALEDAATTTPQHRNVAALRELADQAWTRMLKSHSPDNLQMMHWDKDALSTLRASFSGRPKELALIDALQISAKIYQDQNTAPYASNLARSQLMKRQFMHYYRAAAANGDSPRALFKMGAYHAARGLSPTGLFDIGNLASELAESNGSSSLHILVLAAGGEKNHYYPFSVDKKDQQTAYDGAAELKALDVQLLLDAAATDSVSLFDLTALRDYSQPRAAKGSGLASLMRNYDAVIIVPKVRAATNY